MGISRSFFSTTNCGKPCPWCLEHVDMTETNRKYLEKIGAWPNACVRVIGHKGEAHYCNHCSSAW